MGIPDWLVGIGSALAGGASVWTVVQQWQLNKHEERLEKLEENHE
jgi:hypothetical protein